MPDGIYEIDLEVLDTISWYTLGSHYDAAHRVNIKAVTGETILLWGTFKITMSVIKSWIPRQTYIILSFQCISHSYFVNDYLQTLLSNKKMLMEVLFLAGFCTQGKLIHILWNIQWRYKNVLLFRHILLQLMRLQNHSHASSSYISECECVHVINWYEFQKQFMLTQNIIQF